MQPDPWAELAAEFELSEAELLRLGIFDEILQKTSSHTNLVARPSLPDRFERHYRDSLQLFPLVPSSARSALDIGSGAGFPGLVLASLAQERLTDLSFTLCDSVGKKAAFLKQVVQKAQLNSIQVTSDRVERMPGSRAFDLITARAVTALPALMELAIPRLAPGGLMLFPKGRRAQQEVDAAREQWSFDLEAVPSRTDPEAKILLIREPTRKK